MRRREIRITEEQKQLFTLDSPGEEGLAGLRRRCLECVRCGLSKTRQGAVFGEGNTDRPLVCFVGEAPSGPDDHEGRPFVGKSGQILDKMIAAMGLRRNEVYLLHAVACRPPGSRPPTKEELQACKDYVLGQIRSVRPHVVIALGETALVGLLGGRKKIEDCRGKWYEYHGIPLMATLHPSAVARAETDKERHQELRKMIWGDLQLVLARIGLLPP